MFGLYHAGQDANVVGAGLAPALIQGDRKGRPYTFRVRIYIWYHLILHTYLFILVCPFYPFLWTWNLHYSEGRSVTIVKSLLSLL